MESAKTTLRSAMSFPRNPIMARKLDVDFTEEAQLEWQLKCSKPRPVDTGGISRVVKGDRYEVEYEAEYEMESELGFSVLRGSRIGPEFRGTTESEHGIVEESSR